MKILYDDKPHAIALLLESNREGGDLIDIIAAALRCTDRPLNKQSRAYKLAMQIDNELPIY